MRSSGLSSLAACDLPGPAEQFGPAQSMAASTFFSTTSAALAIATSSPPQHDMSRPLRDCRPSDRAAAAERSQAQLAAGTASACQATHPLAGLVSGTPSHVLATPVHTR